MRGDIKSVYPGIYIRQVLEIQTMNICSSMPICLDKVTVFMEMIRHIGINYRGVEQAMKVVPNCYAFVSIVTQ